MATRPHSSETNPFTWRMAGFGMVVLSLALAVLGIVFSLLQAQSLMNMLMTQAEVRAADLALAARSQFSHRLVQAFRNVSESCRTVGCEAWEVPDDWPVWMNGLFVWDASQLTTLIPPQHEPEVLDRLIVARMTLRPLGATTEPTPEGPELLYDTVDREPVVLAYVRSREAGGKEIALVASVSLPWLKASLIEPLVALSQGLEIVPFTSQPSTTYRRRPQRMFSAMKFWAIRPTDAFEEGQRNAVIGQAVFNLGITVLAVVTMLAARWLTVRLLRREVALAKLKANFVADVSHELKTPLSVIRMFGETLQSGRVLSEEKRAEYYEIITRESTRLTDLINNILDFSRIEAGKQEFVFSPIDVGDVVRETYQAYRTQLDRGGFEYDLSISPTLPLVDADRNAIAQVVINLLSNAMKYSADERFVGIEMTEDTRRGRHGVLLAVHDKGIGIKPEDRAHLFEGFYRADDGRVREVRGTGLGLALVKQIVEAHGGVLDVESRLVKGSTFRVFLPASREQADSSNT